MSRGRVVGIGAWSAFLAFVAGLTASIVTTAWPGIAAVSCVAFVLSVLWEVRHERKPEAEKLRNVWRGSGDERRRRLRARSRSAVWAVEALAVATAAAFVAILSLLPDDGDPSWVSRICGFIGCYTYASTVIAGIALRRRGELPNQPPEPKDPGGPRHHVAPVLRRPQRSDP